MGFCSNCGAQWVETQTFCAKCGKTLPHKQPTNSNPSAEAGNSGNAKVFVIEGQPEYTSSTGSRGFVSPDEVFRYSLKNGVILNLISGEGWKKEDAIITNKRLYYNGKIIKLVGGLSVYRGEAIADLDDITGTKIVEEKPVWRIALAILSLIFGLFILTFSLGQGNGPLGGVFFSLLLLFLCLMLCCTLSRRQITFT